MAYFVVLLADTRNKTTQLVEIQPLDLNLSFELEKPSTLAINLVNVCDHNHVAFKVNTTSPEKYIVHPNTGLIKPNSISKFTVTLIQAQSVVENFADIIKCEDKFLIMTKIAPLLANQDDVTPALWTEDNASYVEENIIRFVLAGEAKSPALNLAKEIELLEAMLNNLEGDFSSAKAEEEGCTTIQVDVKRRLHMGEISKCKLSARLHGWKYWLFIIILFVIVLLVWRFVFYSFAIKGEI